MAQGEITNIVRDNATGFVTSYTENGTVVVPTYDNSGKCVSLVYGAVGSGSVEVFDYNLDGSIRGSTVAPYALGLTQVGRQVLMNGKPYFGCGVNFYDAIDHQASYDSAQSYYTNYKHFFDILVSYGVPFVRVNQGSFGWSSQEWPLYLTNPGEWWARRDAMVQAAQDSGLGLICSMFWFYAAIPNLMYNIYGKRDSLSQWGVSNSNTRNFMRAYTAAFVQRYRNFSSLWGYEFSNEALTYHSDDVNSGNTGRQSLKNWGAPNGGGSYMITCDSTVNGSTDLMFSSDFRSAVIDFMAVVRANESNQRFISTGESVLATNEYNMRVPTSNTDTFAQWYQGSGQYIRDRHPAGVAVSAHIYTTPIIPYWYFSDKSYQASGLIGVYKAYADANNVPFFLGEWGALAGAPEYINGSNGLQAGDVAGEQYLFNASANAIVQNKVVLSCPWNYNYLPNVAAVQNWNIDPGSSREYQLQAIASINARLNA